MDEKSYVLNASELESLRKDASISGAIQELAGILSGRSQDLPHRFRAPSAFGKYLTDYGVNQTYYNQMNITQGGAEGVNLMYTLRPTQKILELIFTSYAGNRLFTLEIEYAVPETGE